MNAPPFGGRAVVSLVRLVSYAPNRTWLVYDDRGGPDHGTEHDSQQSALAMAAQLMVATSGPETPAPLARIVQAVRLVATKTEAPGDTDALLRAAFLLEHQHALIHDAVSGAKRLDDGLDDPHGDGSGNDAQAPDGDSYNELWSTMQYLRKYCEAVS